MFPALGDLLPYPGLFTFANTNDMWAVDLNEVCWPRYKYSVNGILGCQNYDYFTIAVAKTILTIQGREGGSSMKGLPPLCCPLPLRS